MGTVIMGTIMGTVIMGTMLGTMGTMGTMLSTMGTIIATTGTCIMVGITAGTRRITTRLGPYTGLIPYIGLTAITRIRPAITRIRRRACSSAVGTSVSASAAFKLAD